MAVGHAVTLDYPTINYIPSKEAKTGANPTILSYNASEYIA
jgi:hypothetical protein